MELLSDHWRKYEDFMDENNILVARPCTETGELIAHTSHTQVINSKIVVCA